MVEKINILFVKDKSHVLISETPASKKSCSFQTGCEEFPNRNRMKRTNQTSSPNQTAKAPTDFSKHISHYHRQNLTSRNPPQPPLPSKPPSKIPTRTSQSPPDQSVPRQSLTNPFTSRTIADINTKVLEQIKESMFSGGVRGVGGAPAARKCFAELRNKGDVVAVRKTTGGKAVSLAEAVECCAWLWLVVVQRRW